jgi:hypothetical protein
MDKDKKKKMKKKKRQNKSTEENQNSKLESEDVHQLKVSENDSNMHQTQKKDTQQVAPESPPKVTDGRNAAAACTEAQVETSLECSSEQTSPKAKKVRNVSNSESHSSIFDKFSKFQDVDLAKRYALFCNQNKKLHKKVNSMIRRALNG